MVNRVFCLTSTVLLIGINIQTASIANQTNVLLSCPATALATTLEHAATP